MAKPRPTVPGNASAGAISTRPPFDWNVMIYMAGDNNLNDEMIRALVAMRTAAVTNKKVAIFAQFDSAHPAVPTRRYNVQTKTGDSYEIEGERSASKKAVREFVEACVDGDPASGGLFPGCRAENYALILSGHGDGIMGRTLLLDEAPHGRLTIDDLRIVLQRIRNEITNKKLAILGMDSCLMNSIEISYELKNYAERLIASQGNIPNSGWDYGMIAKELNDPAHKALTIDKVANEIIVDSLKGYNRPYAKNGGRSADVSVCDLTHLERPDNLLTAISSLADQLLTALRYEQNGGDSRTRNGHSDSYSIRLIERLVIVAHWRCQRYLSDQVIDLFDFCKCLISEIDAFRHEEAIPKKPVEFAAIRTACQRVIAEISGSIGEGRKRKPRHFVTKGIYSGADNQFSNGVSIFFPWSGLAYSIMKEHYERLSFFEIPAGAKWTTFVKYFTFLTSRETRQQQGSAQRSSALTSRAAAGTAPKGSGVRQTPPFYKGIGTFLDYFGRVSNFPENWTTAEGEFPSDYTVTWRPMPMTKKPVSPRAKKKNSKP